MFFISYSLLLIFLAGIVYVIGIYGEYVNSTASIYTLVRTRVANIITTVYEYTGALRFWRLYVLSWFRLQMC